MIEHRIKIINRLGMHARAAAKLVNLTSKFESDITIERSGKSVNGKSIMGVLMLAASKGSEITLEISGPDEQNALDAICDLIDSRFGEEE